MIEWKIYYADGSTFSNLDGLWDVAPQDGVVCVALRDPDYGKLVLNGLNNYYRVEGTMNEIAHCNDPSPQLHLRCPWLKFGVGTSRETWIKTVVRATKDPDFPPSEAPHRRSTDL